MKNTCRRLIIAALLIAPAASIAGATVVPRDTVIPVTLDAALGSATSRAGSTFYAHHTGVNGAGFPDQTRFTGSVDSVTRASGKTAGQIGVSFSGARLPDGTRVPIVGKLTALDDTSVTTDEATGRLVGTTKARKADLKMIAYGAGGGWLLGQLTGKNKTLLTVLGAAAGYLYGEKAAKPAVGKDVVVPAGTQFGILLTEDATIPDSSGTPSPRSTDAIPTGAGWQVTFDNLRPVMRGNELMVPFRSVMNSIEMPFDYDSATKQISVNNYDVQTTHTVGTRIIDTNGKETKMDVPSRIINGAIYVPAGFIEHLTGRTAYWNQKSGVLRIE
ncbi:MAG TPA: copper amine oxidase N-terminal domain-containing protein [Armatimonadota bacterium]